MLLKVKEEEFRASYKMGKRMLRLSYDITIPGRMSCPAHQDVYPKGPIFTSKYTFAAVTLLPRNIT